MTGSAIPSGAQHAATTGRAPVGTGDPKWWTLTAVCLGTFMLLLDITIVNVALPDIQAELNATFSDLQWVIDAYALTLAALLLTTGSLADLYGRRRLYLIGLLIFTAASAAVRRWPRARSCSSCPAACRASAGRSCSPCRWPCWPTPSAARTAASPSASGARSPGWPWRSARWSAACWSPASPGGGSSSSTCRSACSPSSSTAMQVRESRAPQAHRPDWAGFVLFSGGLACLVYALIESGRSSFSATPVVVCFAGGGGAAGRLRRRRVAGRPADVRPVALPAAHVHRRRHRGLRGVRRRSSRCSCTSSSTCRTCSASARCRPACDADPLRRDPREQRRGGAAELPGARCAR